jgi:phosphatidylglycerophosphate synthase
MKTLNESPLRPLEKIITEKLIPFVPPFIGTKAITFFSLLSSMGVLASYYLCRRSYSFLFLASLFIIMEWVFDCLDGAIGRVRKEGFIAWGYYMDHLFDFFFLAAVVFGLYFLIPRMGFQILFFLFITSSYMVIFFLRQASAKEAEFKISFAIFSPIEFRLSVILFNALFYFNADLIKALISKYFIFLNITLTLLLAVIVYSHQKQLDKYDRTGRRQA